MRINIKEKLQRLEKAASLLLRSNETQDVKFSVGNQIHSYRLVLEESDRLAEHSKPVQDAIAAIDEFCALTEKTFAHLNTQGALQ